MVTTSLCKVGADLLNVSGPQIRHFRTRIGSEWAQARLAQALQAEGIQVDRSGVTKIESGYRRVSDFELVVIAKVLGVNPNDLPPCTSSPSSYP